MGVRSGTDSDKQMTSCKLKIVKEGHESDQDQMIHEAERSDTRSGRDKNYERDKDDGQIRSSEVCLRKVDVSDGYASRYKKLRNQSNIVLNYINHVNQESTISVVSLPDEH